MSAGTPNSCQKPPLVRVSEGDLHMKSCVSTAMPLCRWPGRRVDCAELSQKTLRKIRSTYVKEPEAKVENNEIVEFRT